MDGERSVLLPTLVFQDRRILISTLMTNISAWLRLKHLSDCIWPRTDYSPLRKVCNKFTVMLGKKEQCWNIYPMALEINTGGNIQQTQADQTQTVVLHLVNVNAGLFGGVCVGREGSSSLHGGQASLHCSLLSPDRSASRCKPRESFGGRNPSGRARLLWVCARGLTG